MHDNAHPLELKIPPPVVAALLALAMWSASVSLPTLGIPLATRLVAAIAIAAFGIAVTVSGAVALRRLGTTHNPLKPDTASSLAAVGAFRFTRNPMYVGLAVILVGWAMFLASAWALIGVAIFVAYMTRWQIVPEERALAANFGASYAAYRAKVRRWL
jgi:protein-S-isoprenylcysteine O-methyltransferase Ste14